MDWRRKTQVSPMRQSRLYEPILAPDPRDIPWHRRKRARFYGKKKEFESTGGAVLVPMDTDPPLNAGTGRARRGKWKIIRPQADTRPPKRCAQEDRVLRKR